MRPSYTHRSAAGLAVVTVLGFAGAACAQTVAPGAAPGGPNVGVKDRPRPGYDALGVHAGAFVIYPKVTGRVDHQDNLFASEDRPVDDTVYTLQPEVSIRSDWSRHALSADAQVSAVRHADVRSEDSTTWSAGANGRLDIGRAAELGLKVTASEALEARGSVAYDDVPVDPVTFQTTTVAATASQTFSRVSVSANLDYADVAYDDTRDLIGDLIENSSRDHTLLSGGVRVAYGLSPSTAIFIEGAAQSFDYADDRSVERDGQGRTVLVGVDTEITRLITGEAAFGFIRHDFDNPELADVSTSNYRLGLQWFPTQLVTVGLSGSQRISDSPLDETPEMLVRTLTLRADYELLRNLIVSLQVTGARDDYRGVDRQDDRVAAALGVNYLVNRTLGVTFRYRRQERWSDGEDRGAGFTDNLFGVALVAQR